MLSMQAPGRLGYAEYALTSARSGAVRLLSGQVQCRLKADDQPQARLLDVVDVAARL